MSIRINGKSLGQSLISWLICSMIFFVVIDLIFGVKFTLIELVQNWFLFTVGWFLLDAITWTIYYFIVTRKLKR